MSILLSTYWKEGIVFSADRNATIIYKTRRGPGQYVEVGHLAKVIAWPKKRAVVGFIGLGELAGLRIDEWMRQFIAQTRDYGDIDLLAQELCDLIQEDFNYDHPSGTDIRHAGLIVHLGGFKYYDAVLVPVMHLVTNVPGLKERGGYPDATRDFTVSDQIPGVMKQWGVDYPPGVRDKILEIDKRGDFLWFNNGYMYPAFNAFKGALWQVLQVLRKEAMLPPDPTTIQDRIAFSEMAVRVFGLSFEHHFLPEERVVGGGADSDWIRWPKRH